MKFNVIINMTIEARNKIQAEAAARRLYEGQWDAISHLPEPEVTVILFHGINPAYKVDRRGDTRINL